MEKNMLFSQAWAEYEKSPARAKPDTVSEALAYKATFAEFVAWGNDPGGAPTLSLRINSPGIRTSPTDRWASQFSMMLRASVQMAG